MTTSLDTVGRGVYFSVLSLVAVASVLVRGRERVPELPHHPLLRLIVENPVEPLVEIVDGALVGPPLGPPFALPSRTPLALLLVGNVRQKHTAVDVIVRTTHGIIERLVSGVLGVPAHLQNKKEKT